MTEWSDGYVSEIDYVYSYCPEINPLRLRLIFLFAGLVPPEVGTACELGFGQGVSINLHAAASTTAWHGTDFNPAQVGFAQELAKASGADARLFDEAFADFANRADLPDYDFIGLNGIWSWISDENRKVIVDFVRRKLKVGGVFYISYNSQPGSAAMVPMRDLLLEHNDVMSAPGQGAIKRFDDALGFADKLFSLNPAYTRANPQVVARLKQIRVKNSNYLVHEYFNRNWLPMSFASMTKWLAQAKLDFACSAKYLNHIDTINFSAEQLALLREIPDAMFRETVRDFMTNQEFRREYWVKGARKLDGLAQAEALREQRLVLAQPRADVNLKVTGSLGEATLQETIYNPILDVLADHQPRTIGQIEQAVTSKGVSLLQVIQAVMVLCGNGALEAVQDDATITKAKQQTTKLNSHLISQARSGGEINYLASPVTGSSVTLGRFQQLFLLARSQGKKEPADWAQFVWQILASQGQKITKDGKPLDNEADNIAELKALAKSFTEKQLPVLKALQIV